MFTNLLKLWYETKAVLLADKYKLEDIKCSANDIISLHLMVIHDFDLPYCPVYFYPDEWKRKDIGNNKVMTTLGEDSYENLSKRDVEIRIFQGGNTPYTLLHEFAHLRHKNHGWRFHRFYIQIIKWYLKKRKV